LFHEGKVLMLEWIVEFQEFKNLAHLFQSRMNHLFLQNVDGIRWQDGVSCPQAFQGLGVSLSELMEKGFDNGERLSDGLDAVGFLLEFVNLFFRSEVHPVKVLILSIQHVNLA
jgi:hypothetical protein